MYSLCMLSKASLQLRQMLKTLPSCKSNHINIICKDQDMSNVRSRTFCEWSINNESSNIRNNNNKIRNDHLGLRNNNQNSNSYSSSNCDKRSHNSNSYTYKKISSTQQRQTLEYRLKVLLGDMKKHKRVSLHKLKEIIQQILKEGTVSDDGAHQLLMCCGRLLPQELPSTRIQVTQHLWRTLQELDLPLALNHYNALLLAHLDNEHRFSPAQFLDNIERQSIRPNKLTFYRLLHAYCQIGEMDSAEKLLEQMKLRKFPINASVFEFLMLGYARAREPEKSSGLLQVMQDASVAVTTQTFCALAVALAESANLRGVRNALSQCVEAGLHMSNAQLLEVAYALAVNGHMELFAEVLSSTSRQFQYNQVAKNMVYRLLNAGCAAGARLVYHSMPDVVAGVPGGVGDDFYGEFYVRQMVKLNMPISSILATCSDIHQVRATTRGSISPPHLLLLRALHAAHQYTPGLVYPLMDAIVAENSANKQENWDEKKENWDEKKENWDNKQENVESEQENLGKKQENSGTKQLEFILEKCSKLPPSQDENHLHTIENKLSNEVEFKLKFKQDEDILSATNLKSKMLNCSESKFDCNRLELMPDEDNLNSSDIKFNNDMLDCVGNNRNDKDNFSNVDEYNFNKGIVRVGNGNDKIVSNDQKYTCSETIVAQHHRKTDDVAGTLVYDDVNIATHDVKCSISDTESTHDHDQQMHDNFMLTNCKSSILSHDNNISSETHIKQNNVAGILNKISKNTYEVPDKINIKLNNVKKIQLNEDAIGSSKNNENTSAGHKSKHSYAADIKEKIAHHKVTATSESVEDYGNRSAYENKSMLRPHYFWPIICCCADRGQFEEIYSVIRKMLGYNTRPCVETLADYVFPQLLREEDATIERVIERVQDCGVDTSMAVNAALSYHLQLLDMEQVRQLLWSHPGIALSDDQLGNLAIATYHCLDYPLAAAVMRRIVDSASCRSLGGNRADHSRRALPTQVFVHDTGLNRSRDKLMCRFLLELYVASHGANKHINMAAVLKALREEGLPVGNNILQTMNIEFKGTISAQLVILVASLQQKQRK